MQKASFKNWQKGLMSVGFFGTLVGAVLYLGGVQGATQLAMTLNISNGPGGLDNGLVGHWSFDGTDTTTGQVNDRSGQGNNGSQKNMASSTAYIEGVVGQGLKFDGIEDYVLVSSGPALSTNATLAGWFYWDRSGIDVASLIRDHTAVNGWILGYGFFGTIRFRVGGTEFNTLVSTSTVHNRWVHYAATKNGADVAYYLDGNSVFTGTGAGSTAAVLPWYIMKNGSANSPHQYLKGMADDVRIYNRSLSSDEIKQLYQLGATTKVGVTPTPSAQPGGLSNGLAGHWTFDGTDTTTGLVSDRSGNGNNGSQRTMATSTAYTKGPIGQALKFDGGNDVVQIAHATALCPSSISVSAWFKRQPGETQGTVVGKAGSFDFGISSSNRTVIHAFGSANKAWDFSNTNGSTVDLNWHHLLITYDQSAVRLYLDGVLDATDSTFTGAMACDTGAAAEIGNRLGNVIGFFNGSIDDVRLYNRVLSIDEIKQLYQLGATTKVGVTPTPSTGAGNINNSLVGHWTFDGADTATGQVNDISGNGNHGSQKNISTSTAYVRGRIGQAINLDGSNDFINALSPTTLDNIFASGGTLAAWVRPETCGESGLGTIIEKLAWEFTVCASSARQLELLVNWNSGTGDWTSAANSITLKQWQHVAVVYNSSSVTNDPIFYINGAVSTLVDGNPGGTYGGDAANNVSIGSLDDTTQAFKGSIDDLRMYNRPLSADEIKALYQMGQ